jgi:hypothetical protein
LERANSFLKIDITRLILPSAVIHFSSTVSDLSFLIDGRLNMADHVASVRRSCFHQLRQVRGFLTTAALKTLVHAFISSRLDYSNGLLLGITDSLLGKSQSVQNAAARLITGASKFDHITPVLSDLHWLHVRQRIKFKVALLMYKCLHGLAPSYLAEFCKPVVSVQGRQHLRSAASGMLSVPRARTVFGGSNFAIYGPPRGTVFQVPYELSNCQLARS